MKKMFLVSVVIFVSLSSLIMTSCSNDENFEILNSSQQENSLPIESLSFKTQLVDVLKSNQTKSSDQSLLSTEQIGSLHNSSLAVLKDFGFTDEELKEYSNKNDPSAIFMAAVFVGFSESNQAPTKSDECFSAEKAKDCLYSTLKDAIGVTVVEEIWNAFQAYKCLTKKILKEAVEQGLKKVPGISIAVLIYDYSSCMGWI